MKKGIAFSIMRFVSDVKKTGGTLMVSAAPWKEKILLICNLRLLVVLSR